VANRVEQGIRTTFQGRRLGDAVIGFEEQDVALSLGGRRVLVRVHRSRGLSILAADEAADGVIYDIANYLAAHAAQLGIPESESEQP
jgi:hypothetical protein